jgi:DNA-binding phage protein
MLKTKKIDVIDYLKTEEEIEAYLNAFLEDGDYNYLPLAWLTLPAPVKL